jgi:glycosyltransferase involved in cell wall biosynthesis
MVVNEALACGLPVLASTHSGAGQGLIAGSGAGELFDPLDGSAFAELLGRWCSCDLTGPSFRAREVVAGQTIDATLAVIKRLISDTVVHQGGPSR